MAAAVGAATGKPDAFKFVCRGSVSAQRRDEVLAAAARLGVGDVTIWSGSEFEEHLRLGAEFLLRRLVDGVPFPDAEVDLRDLVEQFQDIGDEQALRMLARAFDRLAFRTPFQLESNLHAFQQAIDDTIRVLSTGIWQMRDGVEINRLPSLHHIRDVRVRQALEVTVRELDQFRRQFKALLDAGEIRHCGYGDPSSPTFILTHRASNEMDRARERVLAAFRKRYPDFAVIMK